MEQFQKAKKLIGLTGHGISHKRLPVIIKDYRIIVTSPNSPTTASLDRLSQTR
ncbi:MAG: hypothetical protein V7L29_08130 [Nostoc sp.]|uniref:hypothetical protein n=1 Tax=Nostoc sp. TaxID=1180 RepID=UPI002FF06C7A